MKNRITLRNKNLTLRVVNDNILKDATIDTVFVDAIKPQHFNSYRSSMVGHADSKALYKHTNVYGKPITNYMSDEEFKDLKNKKAVYINYDKCGMIHIMDMWRDETSLKEILTSMYQAVYDEFIKNKVCKSDVRLRVLTGEKYGLLGPSMGSVLKLTLDVILEVFSQSEQRIIISLYEDNNKSFGKLFFPKDCLYGLVPRT